MMERDEQSRRNVERFREMRIWGELTPSQQAYFLQHPECRPRLFKAWMRLDRTEQEAVRRQPCLPDSHMPPLRGAR
jgi:hypothetical protein